MERPPVGVGAREGRRAWSPVGGQEGVGVTAQQGVSHPSWLGWWGWGNDAQRPLGGEACLWSRAPRNWAGLGHPAQAWGSTWEPQRGRYCQELAPGQSHCHTGSSQSCWRSGRVPLEGWTRGCLEPRAGRGGPGFLWRSWEQGVGSPLGGRASLWGLEVRGEPSPGAVGSPSFRAPFGSPSEQGRACPRPPQVGPGAVWRVQGPRQDGHPLSAAAASSRRCHERAQPPTEAGPIAVWTTGRRGLGSSAPWGLAAAPGVPSSTTACRPGGVLGQPSGPVSGPVQGQGATQPAGGRWAGTVPPKASPHRAPEGQRPPETRPPDPAGRVSVPRGPKASAAQVCGFAVPSAPLCRATSLDRGPGQHVLNPEARPRSGPAPRAHSRPGPGVG